MRTFGEMGQYSSCIIVAFDIIFRKLSNINIYMGGVPIIFSMHHNQIQKIWGRQFLTSCHIISCFKMVTPENSVSNDDVFKRIHKFAQFNYLRLVDELDLAKEFYLFVQKT